jgi:hypothetical protein
MTLIVRQIHFLQDVFGARYKKTQLFRVPPLNNEKQLPAT